MDHCRKRYGGPLLRGGNGPRTYTLQQDPPLHGAWETDPQHKNTVVLALSLPREATTPFAKGRLEIIWSEDGTLESLTT